MFPNFFISLLMVVSSFSFAGDGGFSLFTCSSKSGRTNLSFLIDNLSSSKKPYRVIFAVDGEFVAYDQFAKDYVHTECMGGCTSIHYDYENDVMEVLNDEETLLSVEFISTKEAVLKKGFADPRVEYQRNGYEVGQIGLVCKYFYQEL